MNGICKGSINYDLGNIPIAKQEILLALEIFESLNNPMDISKAKQLIGRILLVENNVDKALKVMIEAYNVLNNEKLFSITYQSIVVSIAETFANRGKFDEAKKWLQKLSIPDENMTISEEIKAQKQMIKIYERYECSVVAIEEVPLDETSKYGIIAGELIDGSDNVYRVSDMVEKPEPKDAPTNMAIIGRYILTPDIFDILKTTQAGKGGEIQITDALLTQAKQGKVIAYKFEGKRFDCGSVDGFVEATNWFYEKRKEL